ncbi:hypothetical protein MAPG_07609 [Magnaporthiopsis poae ATCC 64411]|uniref:Clr5 domain-containing protein n=1 Tax=Magnaporthiopsis poae (strain ATCC 64411 / 73-15) TaxID=644358 RepID=A0A0C4E547_MAGP6|nr:hypothetical protein MAPG_07609 [Magnaporthiopsis poae ATCC 64411]
MTKTWEKHKAAIVTLYKAENRPLHEVQAIMRDRFNFEASIRAYRTRFGKWGLQKYNARRRHSMATYLARPRLDNTPASPQPLEISQAKVPRNMSMPSLSTITATNPYSQCPSYLSPDSSELPSPPIKFEHPCRSTLSDLNDDSCSNYTASYGSESGVYYVGSSQSCYSPRSAAFPSPHMSYSDTNVALLDAIRRDDESMLCQILGSCSQASAYTLLTAQGGTPLHIAVEHRSLAVLPRLLLASSSPNIQDLDGNTPIHCLFKETSWWREEKLLAMAQELLGRTDVNIRNHWGETPFDIAVTQFRPSGLQGSLERVAANVSLRLAAAADDNSPLGIVMVTIVDRLVGSKTVYSSVQPEGWRRATECLCALLEAGARPDSPLGDTPVLSYLLSRPAADTEAFGLTALDYAISMRPQEQPGVVAQQRQVIRELTAQRHGIRRASTRPSSLTAFATHWSADDGFLELSMRLVAAGADTSTIITAQHREYFSENLKYLATVTQRHGDEQASRDPYCLEPHARLDSLQSAVAPGVPLGAAIWISACDLDSWDTAREHLRALEKLMPKPPCPTQRLYDEALRLLSTKFLDGWVRTLRASPSRYYASSDPGTRQAAEQYLSVLALCAGSGEHARPEKRYYDLVGELAVFCSPATGGCHSGYARA